MAESSDQSEGSRIGKKRKSESYQHNNAEASSAHEPQNNGSGQQRSTKRKTGKLVELPGMPLDILFEIFGHLQPYDLLKLARTTKDFRRLLLNKSSISMWKATLENVPGLPECPSTMSIPAWVNLAFSPYCHFCLAHTKNVEWRFRLRICTKCAKEHLANLGERIRQKIMCSEEENGLSYRHYGSLIPTRNKKNAKLYLPSDLEMVEKEYNNLKGDEARQQYILDRAQTVRAILEHAKRCETWTQSQVNDRDEEIRQLKEDRLAAIIQKLEELGWGKDIASIRYPDSLYSVKKVNRPQRLTEKIWANIKDDVLNYMQGIREKRLKREFDALVLERKRIAIEAFRGYVNSKISDNIVMPELPDYCDFEPVKEILNRPVDLEVDLSTFDPIITLLPELTTKWREQIDGLLAQVVKQAKSIHRPSEGTMCYDPDSEEYYQARETTSYPNTTLSEDQLLAKLKLASTLFSCKGISCSSNYYENDYYDDDWYCPRLASKTLFYPQVLGHPCLTLTSAPWMDWFSPQDHSKYLEHGEHGDIERGHWTCSLLTFDAYGSSKAEGIIKLCGLDPSTATTEEMDNLGLRLACRLCPRNPQSGFTVRNNEHEPFKDGLVHPLYGWRAAVRHQKDCHDYPSFVIFKREELPDDILLAEDNHRLKHAHEWSCLHCRNTCKELKLTTIEGFERHFKNKHNNHHTPVMNEDYFRHFTGPDIIASQPTLFVCLKNGRLSVFEPPTMDNPDLSESTDESDRNLVDIVRRWQDAL